MPSLYVHWPFCVSKCPYCDFNSRVSEGIQQARWSAALQRAMETSASTLSWDPLESIFFGGGTPSLMEPEAVWAVIAGAKRLFGLADDVEITLEANPTTAEAGRFRAFREAGVNRLSIGVQSLDDDALAFLGRVHTAAEAVRVVEAAADAFERFSFDLIYSLPGQTTDAWRNELARALDLAGGHVSAYQLSVEPGTDFHRDGVAEADEDAALSLYQATQDVTQTGGFFAYEVSNHARPGEECRHNLTIWRGGDYLGIGPGAHGRITRPDGVVAARANSDPWQWIESVEKTGSVPGSEILLSPQERRDELVMMGLRLGEGIGRNLVETLDVTRIDEFVESGHLIQIDERLAATDTGRLCLDSVLRRLLIR